eukprot:860481-Pyramimonas_sp.AAC.1
MAAETGEKNIWGTHWCIGEYLSQVWSPVYPHVGLNDISRKDNKHRVLKYYVQLRSSKSNNETTPPSLRATNTVAGVYGLKLEPTLHPGCSVASYRRRSGRGCASQEVYASIRCCVAMGFNTSQRLSVTSLWESTLQCSTLHTTVACAPVFSPRVYALTMQATLSNYAQ